MIWPLLVLLMGAQDPSGTVQEEMSVIVRTVKVQVVDKKGVPVKGLSPKNFKLRVNDKKRVPFTLTEIDFSSGVETQTTPLKLEAQAKSKKSAPAIRPKEGRAVAVFWDSTLLDPQGFETSRNAILAFMGKLRPEDVVRIYHSDASLKAQTSFSRDKDALNNALADTKFRGSVFEDFKSIHQEINKINEEWVQRSELRAGTKTNGDRNTRQTQSEEDRSGDMNTLRVRLQHLVAQREHILKQHVRSQMRYLEIIRRDLLPLKGEKSVAMFSGGGSYTPETQSDLERTMAALNGDGVPINAVMVASKSLDMGSTRKRRRQPPPTPKHTNQDKMDQGEAGAFASEEMAEGFNPTRDIMGEDRLQETDLRLDSALQTFAEETGGAFFRVTGRGTAEKMGQKLGDVATHYYNLVYQSEAELDKIKIKMSGKKRGYRLSYSKLVKRRDTSELSKIAASEKFESDLLYGEPRSEFEMDWGHHYFYSQSRGHRTPVYAYLPPGGFPEKGYQLGFVIQNVEGAVLDYRETVILGPKDKPRLYDLLASPEKPALVRFMIRNLDTGKTNLIEQSIDSAVDDKAGLSSLVLSSPEAMPVRPIHFSTEDNLTKLNPAGLTAESRRKLDPFVVDERLLGSGIDQKFPKGLNPRLYFHVQNATEELPKYRIRGVLRNGDKEVQCALKALMVRRMDPTTYSFYGEVDLSQQPPGDYTLVLMFAEPGETKEREFTQKVRIDG